MKENLAQILLYLSHSKALWSSPRLGIVPVNNVFCMFQKNYVSDLEKKIGRSATREGEGSAF